MVIQRVPFTDKYFIFEINRSLKETCIPLSWIPHHCHTQKPKSRGREVQNGDLRTVEPDLAVTRPSVWAGWLLLLTAVLALSPCLPQGWRCGWQPQRFLPPEAVVLKVQGRETLYLAMSGGVFGCNIGMGCVTGIERVEARDAAQHPTTHKTAHDSGFPGPRRQGAMGGNSPLRQRIKHCG